MIEQKKQMASMRDLRFKKKKEEAKVEKQQEMSPLKVPKPKKGMERQKTTIARSLPNKITKQNTTVGGQTGTQVSRNKSNQSGGANYSMFRKSNLKR